MSIDRDIFEHPCMCGKGKRIATYESNDWGPVDSYETLHSGEPSLFVPAPSQTHSQFALQSSHHVFVRDRSGTLVDRRTRRPLEITTDGKTVCFRLPS